MNSITKSPTKSQPTTSQEAVSSVALGNDANIAAATKTRLKKYRMLGYAQHLLIKYDVRDTTGHKPHRSRFCHTCRSYNADNITIKLNSDATNSDASIGNVQTCGSVWSCPVCASRKAVERGRDIGNAIAWAEANKLIPVMITLTARHNLGMRLLEFKGKFKAAWRHFTNRRAWKAFKTNFGVQHWIANREVTRGPSGWHYHMHFLIFLSPSVLVTKDTGTAVDAALTPDWLQALEREKLEGIGKYALKVTAHGEIKAAYLAKLGLSTADDSDDLHYELSGGQNKKGGRNVWGILRHAYHGDEQSERLYIEYVEALQGDNWITASRGLWDIVADWIETQPADKPQPEKLHDWVVIPDFWWRIVKMARGYEKVIECAARSRSIPKLRTLLLMMRDDLIDQGRIPIEYKKKSKAALAIRASRQ